MENRVYLTNVHNYQGIDPETIRVGYWQSPPSQLDMQSSEIEFMQALQNPDCEYQVPIGAEGITRKNLDPVLKKLNLTGGCIGLAFLRAQTGKDPSVLYIGNMYAPNIGSVRGKIINHHQMKDLLKQGANKLLILPHLYDDEKQVLLKLFNPPLNKNDVELFDLYAQSTDDLQGINLMDLAKSFKDPEKMPDEDLKTLGLDVIA